MFSWTEILFRDVGLAAKKLFLHAKSVFVFGISYYFFDVWAAFFIFFGKCAFSKNFLLDSIAFFFINYDLKLSIAYFTVNE